LHGNYTSSTHTKQLNLKTCLVTQCRCSNVPQSICISVQ